MRFWKRINNGVVSVESYGHDQTIINAQEITKAEFDAFIATVPNPDLPAPPFDTAKFLKALEDDPIFKQKVKDLLKP